MQLIKEKLDEFEEFLEVEQTTTIISFILKLLKLILKFIEDRLKSVLKAAHKGIPDTIISREEADRYVVYTYLLIGDIISLKKVK